MTWKKRPTLLDTKTLTQRFAVMVLFMLAEVSKKVGQFRAQDFRSWEVNDLNMLNIILCSGENVSKFSASIFLKNL